MRIDVPFEGRRVSVCQGCGKRTMTLNGYCDRCRALGLGVQRDKFYTDKLSDEERAKRKEFERLQELKKREVEKEPTEEEIGDILKKRTRIYERKREKEKKGSKDPDVPDSVDATFKG